VLHVGSLLVLIAMVSLSGRPFSTQERPFDTELDGTLYHVRCSLHTIKINGVVWSREKIGRRIGRSVDGEALNRDIAMEMLRAPRVRAQPTYTSQGKTRGRSLVMRHPNMLVSNQVMCRYWVKGFCAAGGSCSWKHGTDPKKKNIGELLFAKASENHPVLAWKIVGRLLEMDESELLLLCRSDQQIRQKVDAIACQCRLEEQLPHSKKPRLHSEGSTPSLLENASSFTEATSSEPEDTNSLSEAVFSFPEATSESSPPEATSSLLEPSLSVAMAPRSEATTLIEEPRLHLWKSSTGRQLSEFEQAECQVKSILINFTAETFDVLYGKLQLCCTTFSTFTADCSKIIGVVAREICTRAADQFTFVDIFADLTAKLHSDLDCPDHRSAFKHGLAEHSQLLLAKFLGDLQVVQHPPSEERDAAMHRIIGIVRFYGKLLGRNMFTETCGSFSSASFATCLEKAKAAQACLLDRVTNDQGQLCHLVRLEDSTNEAYCVKDGETALAAYKPAAGQKSGERQGLGPKEGRPAGPREEMAYILDATSLAPAGVPVVACVPEGVLSEWAVDIDSTLEDRSLPRDVKEAQLVVPQNIAESVALFDLRIFCTDRHGGNGFFIGKKPFRVCLFDHELTLPPWQHLGEARFEAWQAWPQLHTPPSKFAQDVVRYEVERKEFSVSILRSLGIDSASITTYHIMLLVLEIAVLEYSMPLGRIAEKVMREYFGDDASTSWLEDLVKRACEIANPDVDQFHFLVALRLLLRRACELEMAA